MGLLHLSKYEQGPLWNTIQWKPRAVLENLEKELFGTNRILDNGHFGTHPEFYCVITLKWVHFGTSTMLILKQASRQIALVPPNQKF